MAMHGKHRRTLQAIYARPTCANIRWADVEALLLALGAVVKEGRGSRLRIFLNGRVAIFHRPHPQPLAPKALVRDVRDFLTSAGVTP